MRAIAARWHTYWLGAGAPDRLGAARALFFGGVFILYVAYDFRAWAEVGPAFWRPVWALRALEHTPPSPATIELLQLVWKGALLFACVGLLTRAATAVAFGLGLYLLGMAESWGKIGHASAHLVVIMGVLALSRCGDAVSVDAWLRGRRVAPSGEHTWPLRMAWLALALMIFASGAAKLRVGAWAWVQPDNLAGILLQRSDDGFFPPAPLSDLNPWIAAQPWLCGAGAVGALVLELAYPIVLFSRRSRWVVLPGAVLFFASIGLLLVPGFAAAVLMSHVAFWVPWDRILAAGAGAAHPAQARRSFVTGRTRA